MTLVYFDYCAIILLAICIFSVLFQRMTAASSGRILLTILIVSFIAACSDAVAILCEGTPYIALLRLSNYLYFFSRNTAPILYLLFLISLTDTWHKLRKSPFLCVILCIPYVELLLMLCANPFTRMIFYFDEAHRYVRGGSFYILYVCSFFYIAFGMYYITRYRKLFSAFKLFTLYMVCFIIIGSVVFQFFFKTWAVEMFAAAVSSLLIMVTIKRPEETVDTDVGLMKSSAFVADVQRSFINQKTFSVIYLMTDKYAALVNLLGYEAAYRLFRTIGEFLNEINHNLGTRADLYYLDSGFFCYVVGDLRRDRISEAVAQISDKLQESRYINGLKIDLRNYLCVVNCPEDFTDFRTMMSFMLSYRNILPRFGRVAYVSDIFKEKHFHFLGEMENIITNALVNRKFEVYYQPIYSVRDKRFRSAEALIRLWDDRYGFIPPGLLIPAAERNGAIGRIGDYVFEEVCRFITSDEFQSLHLDFIEINLSVAQIMQPDFAERYLGILRKYGCPPEKINFEITETAAAEYQNILADNMQRLVKSGITFALDDYGTGYSNLQRISSLPLHIIKLDKSLVDEAYNPRMSVILKQTVQMIRDLKMLIVVEGIETADTASLFSELGCDFIQGYYYARPVPQREFMECVLRQKGSEC